MGIHNLSKVICDNAPSSVKESDIQNYFGRKVAIDASMSLYQFLIAVRQDGNTLTNAEGETTSHLMGVFYRTIRMMDCGIKPVYVFDGAPPDMKSGELEKRRQRRDETEKELEKAEAPEEVEKLQKRLVKVTKQHAAEAQQLLTLMGVPWVQAPGEAEAQCAELVRTGKVFAVGTEDMDALTFGSTVLLRRLTFSEAKKAPIQEYHLERVLRELELNMDQFIDLCILLGCDYCDTIRGIGPKKALEYIKRDGDIETILKKLDKTKYQVPEEWLFDKARVLFHKPLVTPGDDIDLKWSTPDEEGLVEFMVKQGGFSEDRVRGGAKKLCKARQGTTQGRIDSFFTVLPSVQPTKRKSTSSSGKGPANKKKKTGGTPGFKRGK